MNIQSTVELLRKQRFTVCADFNIVDMDKHDAFVAEIAKVAGWIIADKCDAAFTTCHAAEAYKAALNAIEIEIS